jgi:hypothetical protein
MGRASRPDRPASVSIAMANAHAARYFTVNTVNYNARNLPSTHGHDSTLTIAVHQLLTRREWGES